MAMAGDSNPCGNNEACNKGYNGALADKAPTWFQESPDKD